MLRRSLSLALILCSLQAVGCGSVNTAEAPLSSAPGAPQNVLASTRTIGRGFFYFKTAPKEPRITGTVDLQGARSAEIFLVQGPCGPRIQAILDNGQVLLADLNLPLADRLSMLGAADVRPAEFRAEHVWVTPVSTLLATYCDSHPPAGAGAAEVNKVKHFLGLAQSHSINRPFSSVPLSQFSPKSFSDAAQGGSLVDFCRSLVGPIENGETRRYLQENAYSKTHVPVILADDSPTKTLGQLVFDNTIGNVWGGGLLLTLAGKGLGFAAGKLGFESATQKQLDAIQSQLTEVQDQLGQLGLQVATSVLKIDVSASLQGIGNYTTDQIDTLQSISPSAGLPSPYRPFSTDGNNQSNANMQAFTARYSVDTARSFALNILSAILNAGQIGGQNLGNLAMADVETQARLFGSGYDNYSQYGLNNWVFFYDFRNDVVATPNVNRTTNFYVGQVTLAANMLSESSNNALSANNTTQVSLLDQTQQDLNGFRKPQVVGGGIDPQSGALLQNGLAALCKRALQQTPLAFVGGDSPLDSIWAAPSDQENNVGTGRLNGTMWTAWGWETTKSGDGSYDDPDPLMCASFNVNGYNQWYLPSKGEVEALFKHAKALARATGGIKDENLVAYGLHQMKLISDDGYQHAINNGGYVEVYHSWDVDSNHNAKLWVLRSESGNNDPTDFDNGLAFDKGYYGTFWFKPQAGKLAVVLLVRPYPGLPYNALSNSPGSATQNGVPDVVRNSSVAQSLGSGVSFLDSDVALSGNFVPDQVVVGPDTGDNPNPRQLRAYGLWRVDLGTPAVGYRRDVYVPSYYGTIDQGNFGYLAPFASNYLIYRDITNYAEWLSSNTTVAEVNNFPNPVSVLRGANLSAWSGQVTLVNASLSGGTNTAGNLTGASLNGGIVVDGNIQSANLSAGTPLVGTAVNGTIQADDQQTPTAYGGQISSTSVDTLGPVNAIYRPSDAAEVGNVVNCTLNGASLNGGLITVPVQNGNAGQLLVHDSSQPVTITASWLTSPSTVGKASNGPNTVSSSASYLSGNITLNPLPQAQTGLASLFLAPNYATLAPLNNKIPFILTGIRQDGLYEDLTFPANPGDTTWNVFLLGAPGTPPTPQPQLAFQTANPGVANSLFVPPGFVGYVMIQASNNGNPTYSFLNLNNL